MTTAYLNMAAARRRAHEHNDPLALAREIVNRHLVRLMRIRPGQHIPYVPLGKHLPTETLRAMRAACAKLDYMIDNPRLVGDHPEDLTWIVDLVYTPTDGPGDREPLGQTERRDVPVPHPYD